MRVSVLSATVLAASLLSITPGCQRADSAAGPASPSTDRASTDTAPQSAPKSAPTATPTPAPATAATIAQPLLWEVTSPAGKRGYLLGTVHLGVDAQKELPAVVWEQLAAADTVVFETDLSDPSLVGSLQRQDGSTLREELGEDTWSKLEATLGEGMAAGLNGMKASTAASLLLIRGLPMTPSMDVTVAQKARTAGKRIRHLESPQFQLSLLDRYMDAEVVSYALDHLDEIEAMNERLLVAYKSGDAAAIEAVIFDPAAWMATDGDAMDALLLHRNRDWIPKLGEIFTEAEVVFVAVGGGHLVGEQGVPALLAAEGYRVRRVGAADEDPGLR
ncbi:TraB/GumN family protein [Haliangium sp.]|uniref:TraB/GumN family protein n=1 Tax=Haliangium sp. TaxID=2663208 RepID=UPI003D1467A3